MFHLIVLASFPLLPTILAIPTTSAIRTETWLIPRINTHFRTSYTGLPGNPPWPSPPPFNTSISFDLVLPAHHTPSSLPFTTHCLAEFDDGHLPSGSFACAPQPSDREVVSFSLRHYNELRRPEMSFSIVVKSVEESEGEGKGAKRVYWGGVDVEGNVYGKETMHMQCFGGAPMTGMKCEIYGGAFGVGMSGVREGL